ncbi:anti-sigma factor [bacterium]|nr:anti-sigma factor [bacterium]
MNSPDERWWTVRAGEFVLGTLEDNDLFLFERILAHDTSVQVEVAQWERRLAGLNETASERQPGAHVWPLIRERVRRLDGGLSSTDKKHEEDSSLFKHEAIDHELAPTHKEPATEVVRHISSSRKLRIWQSVAGLTTAASVVLGFLLLQKPTALPFSVDGLAVVLSDESGEPYFLVETDYGNLRVRVTALAPPSIDADRDLQLWQALPDQSAVRPVALLPEEPGLSTVFDVDSLIDGSDLFGVSIEPIGAPTDGGPTGPVVAHGDFLLKQNSD